VGSGQTIAKQCHVNNLPLALAAVLSGERLKGLGKHFGKDQALHWKKSSVCLASNYL
jgi:hypothetical protein